MYTKKELAAKIAALKRQNAVHGTGSQELATYVLAYQHCRMADDAEADHALFIQLGFGDDKKRVFKGQLPKGFSPPSIQVEAGHIHASADDEGGLNVGDQLKGDVGDDGSITLTFDKAPAADDPILVFFENAAGAKKKPSIPTA